MSDTPLRTQPKQKRGQQRVEAILNAATAIFAEVGYEQATMIEIAARADTSVGSLYQFFSNKESIIRALVDRYVAQANAVFEDIPAEAFTDMSMQAIVQAILVPLKAFIQNNQAFQVIFSNATSSAYVNEALRQMDERFQARVDSALAIGRPHLSAKERRKYCLVCMVVMKGLLAFAPQTSELTLDEIFEEIEAIYIRYLTPTMGA